MRLSNMLPPSPSNPHRPLHPKTPPRNRAGSTMTPGYQQSPPLTPSRHSNLTNTPTAPETPRRRKTTLYSDCVGSTQFFCLHCYCTNLNIWPHLEYTWLWKPAVLGTQCRHQLTTGKSLYITWPISDPKQPLLEILNLLPSIWFETRGFMESRRGQCNVMDEDEDEEAVEVEHDQAQLDVTQCDFSITHGSEAHVLSNLNLTNIPYSIANSPPQRSNCWKTHRSIWHNQLPPGSFIFPSSQFPKFYNNTNSSQLVRHLQTYHLFTKEWVYWRG